MSSLIDDVDNKIKSDAINSNEIKNKKIDALRLCIWTKLLTVNNVIISFKIG